MMMPGSACRARLSCEDVFDDRDGAVDHQADCDGETTKGRQVRRRANLIHDEKGKQRG
jgi:hypothetical protein